MENNINNTAANSGNQKVTTAEILARIDRVINDNSHIEKALGQLQNLQNTPPGMGSPAWSVAEIVSAREKTNLKMIDLLERIYIGSRPLYDNEAERMKVLLDGLSKFEALEDDSDAVVEIINTYLNTTFGNIYKGFNGGGPKPPKQRGRVNPNLAETLKTAMNIANWHGDSDDEDEDDED